MNFKEFKNIINTIQSDDGAHVYMEVPLGENSFHQIPILSVRQEQNSYFSTLIIEGTNGGRV